MARITIIDYVQNEYPNHMRWVDNEQLERYQRSGGLTDYKVCLVEVCSFQFVFHSVMQAELCLAYYSRAIHPTSMLPVYTQNLGGDHLETQRWFEKLPMFLLSKSKRPRVVAALTRAVEDYRAHGCAVTGTAMPDIWERPVFKRAGAAHAGEKR